MILQHIAVIMDGNGRWAQKQGLTRTQGHKEGLKTVKRIVAAVSQLHIPYITLYVFSTENWKRTTEEVGFLMKLITTHLYAELNFYAEHNLKLKHIGDLEGLPQDVQKEIMKTVAVTQHNTGTTVQLAINYGGKNEIIRAIQRIDLHDSKNLTEEAFEVLLDTKASPPVDLVIRTGGEKRLSNFLLWQAAYAEWYFTDVLWPDFSPEHLRQALAAYVARERRFGALT